LEDIIKLISEHEKVPEKRIAQKALAEELTQLVHGADALKAAQRISEALFGGSPDALTEADYAQLALDGLSAHKGGATTMLQALADTQLAASNREARDFLKGNAVQLNGEVVTDEKLELTKANAKFGKYHLLKRGKRNFALLVLE
jgi:tyrosyl-tRNA synthetase